MGPEVKNVEFKKNILKVCSVWVFLVTYKMDAYHEGHMCCGVKVMCCQDNRIKYLSSPHRTPLHSAHIISYPFKLFIVITYNLGPTFKETSSHCDV